MQTCLIRSTFCPDKPYFESLILYRELFLSRLGRRYFLYGKENKTTYRSFKKSILCRYRKHFEQGIQEKINFCM